MVVLVCILWRLLAGARGVHVQRDVWADVGLCFVLLRPGHDEPEQLRVMQCHSIRIHRLEHG